VLPGAGDKKVPYTFPCKGGQIPVPTLDQIDQVIKDAPDQIDPQVFHDTAGKADFAFLQPAYKKYPALLKKKGTASLAMTSVTIISAGGDRPARGRVCMTTISSEQIYRQISRET
jgi:hypothetical protein